MPSRIFYFKQPALPGNKYIKQGCVINDTPSESIIYWQDIYDKYAAIMYGNILKVVKDKEVAEKIFTEAFIKLTKDNKLATTKVPRSFYLCMFAKTFAQQHKNKDCSPY